MKGRFF